MRPSAAFSIEAILLPPARFFWRRALEILRKQGRARRANAVAWTYHTLHSPPPCMVVVVSCIGRALARFRRFSAVLLLFAAAAERRWCSLLVHKKNTKQLV